MRERPILFSAAMVRALLDGSKTQTRRIYKNRKHPDAGCDMAASELVREPQHVIDRICPYGQPGDRLWVKETFRIMGGRAKGESFRLFESSEVQYRVDRDETHVDKYESPLFMIRDHSRITLEIVSVRVERLQDIREADATAEGTPHSLHFPSGRTAVENYAHLWECLNGDRSWDANPWVWCVTFRRLQPC